jgi:hypothetical protein
MLSVGDFVSIVRAGSTFNGEVIRVGDFVEIGSRHMSWGENGTFRPNDWVEVYHGEDAVFARVWSIAGRDDSNGFVVGVHLMS